MGKASAFKDDNNHQGAIGITWVSLPFHVVTTYTDDIGGLWYATEDAGVNKSLNDEGKAHSRLFLIQALTVFSRIHAMVEP